MSEASYAADILNIFVSNMATRRHMTPKRTQYVDKEVGKTAICRQKYLKKNSHTVNNDFIIQKDTF